MRDAATRRLTMLWVRVRAEVGHRVGPRLMEWEHSMFLMLFGWFLAQPNFGLWSVPNEDTWGLIILALGVIRLASLVVNGLRRQVTSWLRAAAAICSSMVFMLIGVGYIYAGGASAAAVLFPVVALFELFNYARAMHDVGVST